jgi:predicted DNA-binding protein with PD1-like motif
MFLTPVLIARFIGLEFDPNQDITTSLSQLAINCHLNAKGCLPGLGQLAPFLQLQKPSLFIP